MYRGLCTWGQVPKFTAQSLNQRGRMLAVIVHVPGPAYAGLIFQFNPPAMATGSGSFNTASNAVPVPAALLLLTLIVKPMVVVRDGHLILGRNSFRVVHNNDFHRSLSLFQFEP
jgi:hypothetical protein